ncbi:uncharacterized protein HGUI_03738 [Hanseniaspora guilliermondii]|uniref:Uncharacterized protein n=1 Tax=Hanseniaspora guilliermondii TaxID=56406 RepID=A0A1L0CSF3_9ASCO|nr:uncharacterized protein HGUI_03738 [Hanseniaspora guilliermondii]
MKSSLTTKALTFATLSISTLGAPENLLVPESNVESWFGAFKASYANDPSLVANAFDSYFNGNGQSEIENFMKKDAILSSSVLNDNSGDMQSQLLGSLTAKLSSISHSNAFEASANTNTLVLSIIQTFESIDEEFSDDQFSAWSNYEKSENLKTRQLVNKIKLAFQSFDPSSAIDTTVVKQFLSSKSNELLSLKQQSQISNSSYRSNLKFWIYQTLSMIKSFEGFSLVENSDLILREFSSVVSVSGSDQEFIGEIIGELLLAKIRPAMEAGNEDVAAQAVVDVIGDLSAYCSVVAGLISFCYFMAALPPACHIAVGVATLSTVLLVLRTFRNLA